MRKYRVALMQGYTDYYTMTQDSSLIDYNPEERKEFVKWLTDWVEYDINE